MNVIFERLRVYYKNNSNEYELESYDYHTDREYIKVISPYYNTDLYRGWIGDLTCRYERAKEICNRDNVFHNIAKTETYEDVLLTNINVITIDNGGKNYEYVFLKK